MSQALKALRSLQEMCLNDSRDAIEAEIAAVMSSSQGDWPLEWAADIVVAVLAASSGTAHAGTGRIYADSLGGRYFPLGLLSGRCGEWYFRNHI